MTTGDPFPLCHFIYYNSTQEVSFFSTCSSSSFRCCLLSRGSQRDREREIFNGGQLFHHYTYYIPLNNRRSCLENRETCKVEFESAIANYGSKNRHCQFIVQLLYQSQSNDNSRFKESAIRSLIWEMSLDKKTCFFLFNELIPLNLSLYHSRGRINKIIIIITSDQTTT